MGVVGFVQRIFAKQVAFTRKLTVIIVGLRSRRTESDQKLGSQQF